MKTQERPTSKVCTVCNVEKDVSVFYIRKGYVQKYCLECKRAKGRKHYQDNTEAYKEKAAKWAKENIDKRRKIVNNYDAKNRNEIRKYHSNRKDIVNQIRREKYANGDAERIRSSVTAWFHANKHRPEIKAERVRLTAERQRNLKALTPENTDIEAIKAIYKECQLKNIATGIKHNVDHIIPISKGGKHCASNLQILTAFENQSKGAKC